jgi:hypothetical protein
MPGRLGKCLIPGGTEPSLTGYALFATATVMAPITMESADAPRWATSARSAKPEAGRHSGVYRMRESVW